MADLQGKPVIRHRISEATCVVCSSIWGGVAALSTSPVTTVFACLMSAGWFVCALVEQYAASRKECNQ